MSNGKGKKTHDIKTRGAMRTTSRFLNCNIKLQKKKIKIKSILEFLTLFLHQTHFLLQMSVEILQ